MNTVYENADLDAAYNGSYYTIIGVSADEFDKWVNLYKDALAEAKIGEPVKWFIATAEAVNGHFGLKPRKSDQYPAFPAGKDFNLLMFPLDGLNIGKLAMFKIANGDRWFDDVIDNRRRDNRRRN